MKRLSLTLLVASLLAALAVPSVAAASDQSIWNAWNNTSARAFSKAIEKRDRAIRRMLAAEYRNRRLIRKAIKTHPPIIRILGKIAKAVKRQSASSEEGRKAKALILKSLKTWQTAMKLNVKALKYVLKGRRNRASRTFDRQQAAEKRLQRQANQAIELLEAAGVDTGAG
jgi:hypothetical protein